MRVLHLVSYFPPDRVGGVGEVVAHLHGGLLDRGHDSRVLTTGRSVDDPLVLRRGASPTTYAFASLRGWRWLDQVDVVHAQHGEALPLLALTRVLRNRPRIVLTLHVSNRMIARSLRPFVVEGRRYAAEPSATTQRILKSPVKQAMDAVAVRLADAVTFISRSAALDVLGPERGSAATVIYNALPGATSVARPRASDNEILYVGVANHRKRTVLLPAILDRVHDEHPTARLRIVGFDLEDQPALREAFANRGLLDSVSCEGSLRSDQIQPLYEAATMLLLPSAYEGLPMVILEAARSGTPAVATEVGGAAEFIEHGVSGLLAPPDDVVAIAAACSELLSAPDRVTMAGKAAQQTVEDRFGIDRQIDEYLEVYRSVLGRG